MTVEVKSVEDMEAFCRALTREDAAALYRLAGKKKNRGTPLMSAGRFGRFF